MSSAKKAPKARKSGAAAAIAVAVPPVESPDSQSPDVVLNLALTRLGRRLWEVEKRVDRAAEKKQLLTALKDLRSAEARIAKVAAAGIGPVIDSLERLQESIELLGKAVADIPHPKRRMAQAIVMQVYCLLCRDMAHRPVKSDSGRDVQRMFDVMAGMGLPLSLERVRGALSEAVEAVNADRVLEGAHVMASDVRIFMLTTINGVAWHVPGLSDEVLEGQKTT